MACNLIRTHRTHSIQSTMQYNVVCTNVCMHNFQLHCRVEIWNRIQHPGESVTHLTLLQLECTATHRVNQMREPSNVVNWIWTCFPFFLEWLVCLRTNPVSFFFFGLWYDQICWFGLAVILAAFALFVSFLLSYLADKRIKIRQTDRRRIFDTSFPGQNDCVEKSAMNCLLPRKGPAESARPRDPL